MTHGARTSGTSISVTSIRRYAPYVHYPRSRAANTARKHGRHFWTPVNGGWAGPSRSAGAIDNDVILSTFCVSRRRRKMYCGHARLCVCVRVCVSVCVCVCPRPYAHTTACTDPDVTWGVVEAAP